MNLQKRVSITIIFAVTILVAVMFTVFSIQVLFASKNLLLSGILFLIAGIIGVITIILIIRNILHPLEEFVNIISDDNLQILGDKCDIGNERLNNKEVGHLIENLYRYVRGTALCKDDENSQEKGVNFNDNVYEIIMDRAKMIYDTNNALKTINERILEELEMARRIQENLLPSERNFSQRREFSVGSKYQSMESLGGDLYDIIRTGRNGYGFLIADVSGHGIAAALITMMVKVSFNANSGWGIDPSEVCQSVNNELVNMIGDLGYFITAFYCTLNLETGTLKYTNAGHHPLLLYRAVDDSIHSLDSHGSILGVFERSKYHHGVFELQPGDRLLLYTDGIVEARNKKGDFYEHKRLETFLRKHHKMNARRFVDLLIDDIERFGNGNPHEDDRAILYIEYISALENAQQEEDGIRIEARHV